MSLSLSSMTCRQSGASESQGTQLPAQLSFLLRHAESRLTLSQRSAHTSGKATNHIPEFEKVKTDNTYCTLQLLWYQP